MMHLILFFAGILEVFIGVVDFKVTQKNRIVFSCITTYMGGVVWWIGMRILVPHITNFWLFNSNILGAVIGCYLGLKYAPQIDKFFYVERRGRKKPGKTRLKRLK